MFFKTLTHKYIYFEFNFTINLDKMHEIKLYGEVVQFKDKDSDTNQFSLLDVQNYLKEANGNDLKVRINCVGGDVDEAFAIHNELKEYAKKHNAKIVTEVSGKCASSAVIFLLSGDERRISEHSEIFVHNTSTSIEGDYKAMQKGAEDLMRYNTKIAKHYAENTNLSLDDALQLMDLETSIVSDDALALGFVTEAFENPKKAVLNSIVNKYIINNKMAETNTKKSENAFVKAFWNLVGSRSISNKIVFKADNGEVDFYELGSDDIIKVGDKARIDGQPASGAVLMQNGETYIFKDDNSGELIEIVAPKEEGVENSVKNSEEEEAVIADLKKQLEDKQAEIDDLKEEIRQLKEEKGEVENALNKATEVIQNARGKDPIVNKKEKEDLKREKEDVSSAISNWKKSKITNKNK